MFLPPTSSLKTDDEDAPHKAGSGPVAAGGAGRGGGGGPSTDVANFGRINPKSCTSIQPLIGGPYAPGAGGSPLGAQKEDANE